MDTTGPETLEWPAIQLSTVSSAPCRPLKEQTRLVQEQRGQSPRGCGKGAYPRGTVISLLTEYLF